MLSDEGLGELQPQELLEDEYDMSPNPMNVAVFESEEITEEKEEEDEEEDMLPMPKAANEKWAVELEEESGSKEGVYRVAVLNGGWGREVEDGGTQALLMAEKRSIDPDGDTGPQGREEEAGEASIIVINGGAVESGLGMEISGEAWAASKQAIEEGLLLFDFLYSFAGVGVMGEGGGVHYKDEGGGRWYC